MEGRNSLMNMKRVVRTGVRVMSYWFGADAVTAGENANDFHRMHQIEIVFHEVGTTKNLDPMLSLFTRDATISSGGKSTAARIRLGSIGGLRAPFQRQNQWVAYTPAFRIRHKLLKVTTRISISSVCMSIRLRTRLLRTQIQMTTSCASVEKWLIKQMTAATVPGPEQRR